MRRTVRMKHRRKRSSYSAGCVAHMGHFGVIRPIGPIGLIGYNGSHMTRALVIPAGLFLLAGVTLLFCVRVLDPDVLMHLKTGQWILFHSVIPKTDIFSANASGLPWTTHEWLWQVIAYAAY